MHGAMRCFDKVSDLVKEVLKEICVDERISSSWQDNGEKRAFQEEKTACTEDLHCRGAWWRQRIWRYFFFKPTCLKKKEWPRWKIRPERRWRPHLAGHVLGWGDRDEYKSIFTGHVETFCRNSLFIVKITLATLGGKWPDGWMSWRLLQAATWEAEVRRIPGELLLGVSTPLSPIPPSTL